MKKNKAFTLIELLAVIVILAIIALISTPIVLNIINKSKKSAFLDTAYGIVESARVYYAEQALDGGIPTNKEFKFDSENELKYNGTKPKGGSLILTDKGEVSLAIHNGNWCASKSRNESKVTIKKYEESTCTIPDDIKVPDIPEKKEFTFYEIMNESSEVMSIDPDHNPRYVGVNPSNYVKFNDELWRIIGIFNGQAKIIRNEFYSESIAWDSNYTNDWTLSTLQKELNGTYLNSINPTYKAMIDETHVWNIGGTTSGVSNSKWTRVNFYNSERGTVTWNKRPVVWTGAIGLLYVSDYGYSTNSMDSECDDTMFDWDQSYAINCKDNSWLYKPSYTQWTLSPSTASNTFVLYIYKKAFISEYDSNMSFAATPVLYLKSEVKITSGTGSSIDPYLLSMN